MSNVKTKTKLIGLILAGGKGTRINSTKKNKVTLNFLGKPIILYGVEVFEKTVDEIIVVIGAFAESVQEVLKNKKVHYVKQNPPLGTGHALKVAIPTLEKLNADTVLVGSGDHMMFYTPEMVKTFYNFHKKSKATVSLLTTTYPNPEELHWGIIVRDKKGNVKEIVEYKDATDNQRRINELNSGFYAFEFGFLKKYIDDIKPSPITGEYYVTKLVDIANRNNYKVAALKVPFEYIGIGVNTREELEKAEKLYKNSKS